MGRRVSAYRIKMNRHYTYEQAAETLGVAVQTVRAWRDEGLHVLMGQIPHIIMGYALKDFITERRRKAKRPLKDDEVLCMRCKAPRTPFGMMADYVPTSITSGRLETLCGTCEGRCSRLVQASEIPRLSEKLEIVTSGNRDD